MPPSFRPFRLAITGKLASGKSTLSNVLRAAGIVVLDADTIAREVMSSDETLRSAIKQIIGKDAYTEEGELNTSHIAKEIFSNPKRKSELESLVHAATWLKVEEQFVAAKPKTIVALESAILYQTGYDALFDALILVDATDEVAKANAVRSGRFTPEDIDARLQSQRYHDEWKEDADFVLTNDCPLEEFTGRCEKLAVIVGLFKTQDLPPFPLRMGPPKKGGKTKG